LDKFVLDVGRKNSRVGG